MARNIFNDRSLPAAPLTDPHPNPYPWPINHSDEDEVGRDRNITLEANTGNVGLVKQQGELTPLTFRYSGTILTRAQLSQMLFWFTKCETHSIDFTDFAGDSYEVLITSFKPTRHRTLRNPRDPGAPLWYWTYTIEMMVLTVRAGAWLGQPA
jgi:hypothetical protein